MSFGDGNCRHETPSLDLVGDVDRAAWVTQDQASRCRRGAPGLDGATLARASKVGIPVRELEGELLEVDDLKVHYPSRGGWLTARGAPIKAVDGLSTADRPGTNAGARWRKWQRQEHDGARHPLAAATDGRERAVKG